MGITLPLAKMTLEEKLAVMEQIWNDLTAKEKKWEPPAWHGAIVEARLKGIDDGTEEILDLEDAWAELESDSSQ